MSSVSLESSQSKIVLAIDPGFDRVGWAVAAADSVHQISIKDFGCITTDRQHKLARRYQTISQEVESIIQQYQPVELAIEQIFFAKSTTTALKVSEARGVILATAIRYGLKIWEYSPPQIKLAVTGNGKADKAAMAKMLRLQLNLTGPLQDDAADALGLIITHASCQVPAIRGTTTT